MSGYDVEYKKEVLRFLEDNGISLNSSKYGHDPSVINRWKQKARHNQLMRKISKR